MKFHEPLTGKYCFKLSISIIAFSMAMVITISFIFSEIYSKSLSEQMMNEYKASINKMDISFTNLNKEADQLYLLLSLDIEVYTFLNESRIDYVTKAHASINANRIYQINPYVDSIILYNMKTRDNILIGKGEFDPKGIIKEVEQVIERTDEVKCFISGEAEDSYYGKKNFISLVYRDTSYFDKNMGSIVIINMDRDAVKNGILEKTNGTTFICRPDGREIISAYSNTPSTAQPLTEYINAVIADGKDSNSLSIKINNETNILTYDRNHKWIVLNVMKYNDMTYSIREKRNIITIIAIAVVLACLLIGYIISRMVYSPIRKVTNMFKNSRYADGISKRGEITLISDVYNEVMKHVVILEKENENFLPKIKEDFLRNILKNGDFGEEVESRLKDYQIGVEFINLFIVIIKIDNDGISENKKLFETTAVNSSLKSFGKSFKSEIVGMYDGEYCLMLNFLDEKVNNLDILISSLEDIISTIKKILGGGVTAAIGGVANSTAECPDVYAKASELMKYRFVLGYDKVIYQRYIEDNLTSGVNYPKEIEKKLTNAIHSNSRENFILHLESIINTLKNYIYNDAMVIFLQTMLECIKVMDQVTSGYKTLRVEFDVFDFKFSDIQTLEQAKKWMIGMFDEYQELIQEIDSLKSNKYFDMIESIKEYIDESYADMNLSVEKLSERVGYSPNYFGKVFKNITGIYVNDYIKQVRITKAKELLRNSNHCINEISNMVGFINTTYFYSAFRKDVGLTPSSYRNYKIIEN